MGTHVIATTHDTYQAHHRDTLLSEVACVHLLLLPRALVLAGFSEEGEVLVIRHSMYAAEYPEWALHFFEEEFINDPLLGVPTQVKAVFALSDEHLLVPEGLYDPLEAKTWLQSLYLPEKDAWYGHYRLVADQAHYLFTLPGPIHRLLERYFGHTSVLPLAAYQFYKPGVHDPYQLQCLVSGDEVVATLRQKGRLLWHQQFSYQEVTDIVWHFAHLCRQHHISVTELHIECTALCDTSFDLITDLQTFFPKLKWSAQSAGAEGRWTPSVYLLQQIYACAL